jgi:hypothetical protein
MLCYKRTACVKVYWDDEKQVNSEEYEDLTEDELTLMLADETVEVVEQDKRKVGEVPVPPTPEEMMAAQQMGVMPEPRMEPSLSTM